MNKKAEFGVGSIVLIILLVLIFIAITVLVVIRINQGIDNPDETENKIDIYVNNLDNKSNIQISGKYYLLYEQEVLSTGDLDSNSFSEIKGIGYSKVTVYCKEKGYYLTSKEKNFTEIEMKNNASKITCLSDAYGDLIIGSTSDINNEEGKIILHLSSKRKFNDISGVISWKSGTIWVKYQNKESLNIPDRFRDLKDYYFETNQSIDNSNITLVLDYKAIEKRNSEDCITITLFDKDYYLGNGELILSDYYNGENLGNPKDFPITFCYGE